MATAAELRAAYNDKLAEAEELREKAEEAEQNEADSAEAGEAPAE
jgi:hypothetical protein